MPSKYSHQFCLVLLIVFMHGCASYTPTTTPEDSTNTTKIDNPRTNFNEIPANSTGDEIVAAAKSLIGTPYLFGGNSPQGFDCSGLVYYSYQTLGIPVARTTKQLAKQATTLSKEEAQPGDLLFFRTFGSNVSHVGIYAGKNQFIHAPKSGKRVSYASIEEPYWRDRLIKAGRLH